MSIAIGGSRSQQQPAVPFLCVPTPENRMSIKNADKAQLSPPSAEDNSLGSSTAKQNHLAPPSVTPDSPRPQKNEQSPLAGATLNIKVPTIAADKPPNSQK